MVFKVLMIEVHKHYAYVQADTKMEAKDLMEALQKQEYDIWKHEEGNMGNIVDLEMIKFPPTGVYINSKKDLKNEY
tara:strand:- start:2856 stop:3083 length:228 start_codon:yes stop_codon:yes gene_type:complete